MKKFKAIYSNLVKSSFSKKILIFRALWYMFYVRMLMLFVKYKRYEKHLGERGIETEKNIPEDFDDTIQEIRRVVIGLSRYTPWESKCMVQALACKWLLTRKGIKSTIYFGISGQKELKAHAWLRVGEKIVTGKKGHKQFKIVNFYS